MSTTETIIGIGAGLVVNEFCDISPWAAQKIVTWSAHMKYGKSPRAAIRTEELCALVDSRPGKLFKLVTALAFAVGATRTCASRSVVFWRLLIEVSVLGADFISSERVPPGKPSQEKLDSLMLTSMLGQGVDLDTAELTSPLYPTPNMLQRAGRVNRKH